MNFYYAAFEFTSDPALVHRYRYSNSSMVTRELSVAVLNSKILEGDLPTGLSVHFNHIIRGALQFHLSLVHIW